MFISLCHTFCQEDFVKDGFLAGSDNDDSLFFEDDSKPPAQKQAWGDVMEESIQKEEAAKERRVPTRDTDFNWRQDRKEEKESRREKVAPTEFKRTDTKAIPSLLSAELCFPDDRPPAKKLKDEFDSYRNRKDEQLSSDRSKGGRGRGKSEFYRSGPSGRGRPRNSGGQGGGRQSRDDGAPTLRGGGGGGVLVERTNSKSEKEPKKAIGPSTAEKDVKREKHNPWFQQKEMERSNTSNVWHSTDAAPEPVSTGSFSVWHNSSLDGAKKDSKSQNVWHNKKMESSASDGKQNNAWPGRNAKWDKETPESSWPDSSSAEVIKPCSNEPVALLAELPKETGSKDWKNDQPVEEANIWKNPSGGVATEKSQTEWQNSKIAEQPSAKTDPSPRQDPPENVWLKRSAEMNQQRRTTESHHHHQNNQNLQTGPDHDDSHQREYNRSNSRKQTGQDLGRQDSRDSTGNRRNRDSDRRKTDSQLHRRQPRDGPSSAWPQQRPRYGGQYGEREGSHWDRSSEPPSSSNVPAELHTDRQLRLSRDDLTDASKRRESAAEAAGVVERLKPQDEETGKAEEDGGYKETTQNNNDNVVSDDRRHGRQGGNRPRNEYRSNRGANSRTRRDARYWQESSSQSGSRGGAWSERQVDEENPDAERRYHRERRDGDARRNRGPGITGSSYHRSSGHSDSVPRGRGQGRGGGA